jgi:lipopolysaccharide export system permease protein
MRACGVNLLSVMKWPLLFGLACSFVGVYVNNEIVPRGHELRRSLKAKVSVDAGLDVLEPGRVITDFPKMKIYFGSKEGNWLYDIVVMDYSNPDVDRMITASKALVESSGRDISLDLYNMTVDPLDAEHPAMARAHRFQYLVKDALKQSKYTKKEKDLRLFELLDRIRGLDAQVRDAKAYGKVKDMERKLLMKDRCDLKVELSKRFVFAMASFCFVLVGVPLGIKAQRKESTIGMAIALAVSLGYYLVVILMLSLHKNYSIHPEILIWSGVAACLLLASRLIPKNL